jgi:hypothetical protein
VYLINVFSPPRQSQGFPAMSFSFLCFGIQLQFSADPSDEVIESRLSYTIAVTQNSPRNAGWHWTPSCWNDWSDLYRLNQS